MVVGVRPAGDVGVDYGVGPLLVALDVQGDELAAGSAGDERLAGQVDALALPRAAKDQARQPGCVPGQDHEPAGPPGVQVTAKRHPEGAGVRRRDANTGG